jgi:predicted dinucleotide-binding enzyme
MFVKSECFTLASLSMLWLIGAIFVSSRRSSVQSLPSTKGSLFPHFVGVPVVKAFNVLSAYSLSLQDPGVHNIPIASDHQHAKEVVCDLIQKMGFFPEDRGSLIMARQVKINKAMFPLAKVSAVMLATATHDSHYLGALATLCVET